MTERATSFGAVAAAYERFRPDYPPAVVDEVLAYAARPIRTAFEIGAGTGKATRAFADRDIAITACEPDAAMLAELRLHVSTPVTTFHGRFEEVTPTTSYDLVFAAASLHWTEPLMRWARIAALLHPGGVFACFGGQLHLADERIESAVRAARAPLLESDDIPPPDSTPSGSTSADSPLQWPGTELIASTLFTDTRQSTVPRRLTMSAADYIGHLSTVSAYLALPDATRQEVFRRIRNALPDQVDTTCDIDVHLARKC